MESTQFAEEIDFNELQFREVVGRGAFGVVSRARWRQIDVAVKLIETETERKAFITELKQLSRVSHPNIVQLYGACTKQPVCLVMEYAEGGSLYNVLHGAGPQPDYTAAHAMSWATQCAMGVNYLHNMKPKPLIHRDLKPPNLLLIAGGTQLKICDFGTACDAHTHMTNNKGSAAWMAPEVFEGSNYSEKCDVFSFGIILWEVISRRKPFDEIGGPAFRIMWAVHNGTRPPFIKNCPKPIEILMTRCWDANPAVRPSMAEVERIMTHLFQFFEGADIPLVYPATDDVEGEPSNMSTHLQSSVFDTPPLTETSQSLSEVRGHTLQDTIKFAINRLGEPVHIPPAHPCTRPRVIEDGNHQRTSAPASLAASRESLLDGKGSRSSTPSFDFVTKRYSADLSKLEETDIMNQASNREVPSQPQTFHGHRRSGSHGTTFLRSGGTGTGSSPPCTPVGSAARGHRRTGSYGNSPLLSSPAELTTQSPSTLAHCPTAPARLANNAESPYADWSPGLGANIGEVKNTDAAANMAFLVLDHQLQPLAPCTTSQESMDIYYQHCQLAQEYLRVQTEIALLSQRNEELTRELLHGESVSSSHAVEEFAQLANENESLMLLHKNLKMQVELIRNKQSQPYREGPAGTRR